jgi:hypothetical protein
MNNWFWEPTIGFPQEMIGSGGQWRPNICFSNEIIGSGGQLLVSLRKNQKKQKTLKKLYFKSPGGGS